jgi:hypothetical protein
MPRIGSRDLVLDSNDISSPLPSTGTAGLSNQINTRQSYPLFVVVHKVMWLI